ncbi:alpha/beta hydrolase [Tessaracoccus antarcticus]|uniref:Alpha/beta hydrolase n=1 Tax=Tessaracoccus antarcticus TaxID=2479848 RepID=A0A3M0G0R1_9ACTN|nr:alpha/beta hydrolase [Tessaracoccus antarcticus]RMB58208.1 alpha/beta hydrolase [Tessaracoccus antarcticus]
MTTWARDTLLASFEQTTIELPDASVYANEDEGSLCATLVRRNPSRRRQAMLYIHGWSDYFFQAHLADEMNALGYDFYALDLRRYGRSLRQRQLAGFVTDLSAYHTELDEAVRIITAEGHDELVVMGHSTGGLIAALWADEHPGQVSAVVLNSPWLELQGYPAVRPALLPMFSAARSLSPTAVLPLSETGFYRRCISSTQDGVWDYNLNLKGDKAFAVRVGWLAAIMQGQARVGAGLTIDAPVLTLISDRSDFRRKWSEELRSADVVLDVETLASRTANLGRHTTLVRIEGGMHDLALSDEPARGRYFSEMSRWLATYGRP